MKIYLFFQAVTGLINGCTTETLTKHMVICFLLHKPSKQDEQYMLDRAGELKMNP